MAALPLIVLATIGIFAGAFAETVPVLMWGSNSRSAPALSNPQARLIESITKSPLTLAFVEDMLTAEDISLCKVELEGSCFSYLSGVRSKSYSQISQPVDRIEDASANLKYVQVDKDGKLSEDIPLKDATVVVISLAQDPELSRQENLEKHDQYIKRIYNEVVSNVDEEKVLALYTGKSSGNLVRKVRQATAVPTTPSTSTSTASTTPAAPVGTPAPGQQGEDVIFSQPELLIYFTSLTFTEDKKTPTTLKATGMTISNKNDSAFLVTVATQEGDVKFNVNNGADGYWAVNDVQFGKYEHLITMPPVGAADGFSYYCGPATIFRNNNGTMLSWINLQLQPAFGNTTLKQFSDPYNCVGFTSIPIWSGLFVTVILLLILSIGITWLMDIRTMDRFDDPKGKTIAVNTLD